MRGPEEARGWLGARKNAPDAHVGAGQVGQLDGARETLVTLGVVVLQADLKLNGLEEVTLLLVEGVLQQLLDILAHAGWESISECSLVLSQTYNRHKAAHTDCDLRHDGDSLPKEIFLWCGSASNVEEQKK
jgi:hypothetical protein